MAKFHLPTIEEELLKKWEANRIFEKVLAKESPKGDFVFFEGPPTANGKPGIHHVLARAFKDIILRFRTMQGYHIDRKAGWDTHGLPVELEVEKRLGFTKKQDIETYGIAKFNAECRQSVWTYLELWEKLTRRMAYWVDMSDPYITYKNDYVESLWWILKEIDRKGLLYQGYRVTPHCPRCVTSLSSHELAQGYKDTEDPSVFVKFPINAGKKVYFLVWTTTPWTLPGNVALAVGPKVGYVEAKMKTTGETLILARARLSALDGEYEIVKEALGSELVGQSYAPLYDTLPVDDANKARAYKVYAADFVSTEDGTGIVHIAPAFGEDDAKLGTAEKLPTIVTVDGTGAMLDMPGMLEAAKRKFFKKADAEVMADLTARGLLYKSGTYVHSYPFCWRCGTPLLYYAKTSWYIRMSELRDKLMARNADIHWVPEHIKDGRFGEWLKEVKDWALSRERYWGTPLPVWKCGDCQERKVVGSLAELTELRRPANRYFLQRHGESETNACGELSCWPEKKEYHLTAKGREQVAASAQKLKEAKIDFIFASDLLRTTETAKIISEATGVPVVFDERLRELGMGEYNGHTEAEYHTTVSNKVERFTKAVAGGETLRDCRRRMVGFFKDIEAKYSGKNIVIVSHGDPLWLLLTGYRGLSDEAAVASKDYNGLGESREFGVDNAPRDEEGRVDVHRPYIDEVRLQCPSCRGEMRRVPDLIDVWFDSGAMPYAQWHYPFADKERIDTGRNFPADYISEAIDQTRGWFYTLLAVSTLLDKATPPFKNVICLGHILDAKGQKMSKSKGNVVEPFAAMDKFGADVIRYYLFTVNQPGEPKRFDEKAVDEVLKKVFMILWNVLAFYQMHVPPGTQAPSNAPARPGHALDRWILAELAALNGKVTDGLAKYEVIDAGRAIGDFINDLSTWYVRRSRDRFKSGEPAEKAEALAVFGHVLLTLAKLLAPFAPFVSDALYAELGGAKESIHLDEWPAVGGSADETLRMQMARVRQAASIGLEKRAAAAIAVRQALAKATVSMAEEPADWMGEIVAEELNVESVDWKKSTDSSLSVELDTVITPALKRKGAARELVRNINDLRKTAGLTIQDRVVVHHEVTGEFWKQVLAEHGQVVANGTLSLKLEAGRSENIGEKELEIDGEKIWIGIVKN